MPRIVEGRDVKLKAPPGACDTHIHFLLSRFPTHNTDAPRPPDASVEEYAIIQRRLGVERAVIVQPNAYGLDNSCTLHTLERLGEPTRAVVYVTPETPEVELMRMHDLGVRGARIFELPSGAVGLGQAVEVEARVRQFGWHVITQFDGRRIAEYAPVLSRLQGDHVIDHAGKFLEPVSPDGPEFAEFLRLIDKGNVYVKISAAYETSKDGAPNYRDVGAISKALIAHAPERMLWATNWPHVSATEANMPDDADLLDVLLDWAPDEAVRRRILCENPKKLYEFPDGL